MLTFHDMHMWLEQEEICVNDCEPADFLRGDSEILRLYPIAGGIIKHSSAARAATCRTIIS